MNQQFNYVITAGGFTIDIPLVTKVKRFSNLPTYDRNRIICVQLPNSGGKSTLLLYYPDGETYFVEMTEAELAANFPWFYANRKDQVKSLFQ